MIDIVIITLLTIILSSEKRPKSKSFTISVLLGYLFLSIIKESLQILNNPNCQNTQEISFNLIQNLIYSSNHTFVGLAYCYIDIKQGGHVLVRYYDYKLKIVYIYSAITFYYLNIAEKVLLIGFLIYLAYQHSTYFFQSSSNICLLFLITNSIIFINNNFGFSNPVEYFFYYIFYPLVTIGFLFIFQIFSFEHGYMLPYSGDDKTLVNFLLDRKSRTNWKSVYVRIEYYCFSFISCLAIYMAYKYLFEMSSYIKMHLIFILSYPLAGSMSCSTNSNFFGTYRKNIPSVIFGLLVYGVVFDLISFSE